MNSSLPLNPFIESCVTHLQATHPDSRLRSDFEHDWSDQIEALYQEYLHERAVRETALEKPILMTHLEDIGMSTRTVNGLKTAGIQTIGDLVQYSEMELLGIRGFGGKAMSEVILWLSGHGLTLVEGKDRTIKVCSRH